ncbi:MAG: ACT domain-containing protein [Clostridia bacterium]|nr:ACT domain-containing protein [Clostridia bacterium]
MKAFVSVLGMDQKGIIKAVTTVLSDREINILDINQTIVDGYFTMVMQVDLTDMTVELNALKEALNAAGDQLKLKIKVQHEAIFTAMHRI